MSKLKKSGKVTIAARTRKSEKRYGTRSDPLYEMIVYALFLTEEAKGKQERMCAVAQNSSRNSGMTCIV